MKVEEGIKQTAIGVLEAEAKVLGALVASVDESFINGVNLVHGCIGRVALIGVGKSGHISRKIASTLASTGTPAFFVNAAEAGHGDMGMLTTGDVALILSNSGETKEVLSLLPILGQMNIPVIAITGNAQSSLAVFANYHLSVPEEEVACPLGLAPMSSTTAMLALGDAFAAAIFEKRGFSREQFARSHPGGALGKRLTLHVKDIMHTGASMPIVGSKASLLDVIMKITETGLGFAIIVNDQNEALGVFTDGDLRRLLETGVNVHKASIGSVMNKYFKKVAKEKLAFDTLTMMRDLKINGLPVVNENNRVVGAVNLHDLLKLGFNL